MQTYFVIEATKLRQHEKSDNDTKSNNSLIGRKVVTSKKPIKNQF